MDAPAAPPTKYAVALFPGFQALDAFGPLDTLNNLSESKPLELSILSSSLEPVSTALVPGGLGQSVVPTHTFDGAPADIEVLLVPGGYGTQDAAVVQPTVDFLRARFSRLRYLLTVCTGSALAAEAGVLDGRRATSNKIHFRRVMEKGPRVDWVLEARWVADGNVWTASGISAGIDMMYAFVADMYGEDVAQELADMAEYRRNTDASNDPFARFAGL